MTGYKCGCRGCFARRAQLGKVPYTDPGIAKLDNAIRGRLQIAVEVGFLAPGFTVVVPTAASQARQIARLVSFAGTASMRRLLARFTSSTSPAA